MAREDGRDALLWAAPIGLASRCATVVRPLPWDDGLKALLKPAVSNSARPSCNPGTARFSFRRSVEASGGGGAGQGEWARTLGTIRKEACRPVDSDTGNMMFVSTLKRKEMCNTRGYPPSSALDTAPTPSLAMRCAQDIGKQGDGKNFEDKEGKDKGGRKDEKGKIA